jgi:hypothetical protein
VNVIVTPQVPRALTPQERKSSGMHWQLDFSVASEWWMQAH